jgi:predicted phosphodiesterase
LHNTQKPDTDAIIESYLHEFTGNVKGYSRLLFERTGKRSAKAWEAAMRRYMKRNGMKTNGAGSNQHFTNDNSASKSTISDEIEDEEHWVDDAEYYYDQATDCYYTYLRTASQNVKVPGPTHRAIKEAYSNMVGKGSTINQIARDFNFPRHWFDEYRRKHGWTHDMDPFTNEEMLENDPEELVDDLILRRRRVLHKRYTQKQWDEIKKDANHWVNFDETVLKAFKEHLKNLKPTKIPTLKMTEKAQDYALVISPTDFHWGKGGWVDEVGEHFDLPEAETRLFEKTSELIDRLPGRPEKIFCATGSDWFHVDNHQGATTKGTPQDMSGSPAQILITGCELARRHIDLLRQVAPVEVLFMRGNHDKHSSLTLMLYLSAVYENVDDVEVRIDPKVRHYASYGKTLLGFTHGDGVRHGTLPSIMAAEEAKMWGNSDFRVWFTGHRHHQHLKEERGCTVYTLPSLAGKDRWHYQAGYISQPGLAAHLIDKEIGVIGSLFAPVLK